MQQQKHQLGQSKTLKIILYIIACIAIAVIVAFLIVSLFFGKTTTTGQNPSDETSESLSCTSSDYTYPFFSTNGSTGNQTTITAMFDNSHIQSISLATSLFYSSADEISNSEATNRSKMNSSFSASRLSSDSLGATYSKLTDRMQLSLYASSSQLNTTTAKYFLLDTGASDIYPNTLSEIQSIYQQKGFNCSVKK